MLPLSKTGFNKIRTPILWKSTRFVRFILPHNESKHSNVGGKLQNN